MNSLYFVFALVAVVSASESMKMKPMKPVAVSQHSADEKDDFVEVVRDEKPRQQPSNLLDCIPGEEWTRNNVNFRCTSEESRRSYNALNCVSDDGAEIAVGMLHREKEFEYECRRDDVDTLEYRVSRCYSPKGIPIESGQSIVENHGSEEKPDMILYTCEEHFDSDEGLGERVVQLSSTRDIHCRDGHRHVEVGEKVVRAPGIFVCMIRSGKPVLTITGCVLPDGTEVGKWAVVGQYYCKVDYEVNSCEPVRQEYKCKNHNGREVSIGSTWQHEHTEYKCEVRHSRRHPGAQVKPKQCIFEVTYEKDGQSHMQRKRVDLNHVDRMKDGKSYWCKPVGSGQNGRPHYEMTKISSHQAKCSNGRRVNKNWVHNNVHSKCYFINGAAQVRDKQCVTDDRQPVRRMKTIRVGDSAYMCEPNGANKLRLRKMSDTEYAQYLIAEGAIKGKSGWGRGVQQYHSDGRAICEDGFQPADNNECEDINECFEGTHNCGQLESCRNTEGSFECVCTAGFARTDDGACEKVFCPCQHGQDCFDCV